MAVQVRRRGADRKKTKRAASAWLDDGSVRGWGNEVFALILFAFTTFLSATVVAAIAPKLVAGSSAERLFDGLPALLGPFGSSLGTALTRLLGWCSIVPVIWLGWFSWFTWSLDENEEPFALRKKVVQFGGALLLLIFSCTLSSVMFTPSAGGFIGEVLGLPTVRLFGAAGASMLHGALFIAALSLSTKKSIGELLSNIRRGIVKTAAIALIIAPVYITRLAWDAAKGALNLAGFLWRVLTKGWGSAFSASVLEPVQEIPQPRRKKKEIGTEFELGIGSREAAKPSAEPSKKPAEPDIENAPDEEQYSHVVVQRRRAILNADERLPSSKGKAKAKSSDDDDAPVQGDFSSYKSPSFDLLTRGEIEVPGDDDEELLNKSRQIEAKLRDFNIQGRVTEVHPGPVITLFEFEPAAGVKVGKIAALQDDLAMSLRATSIRIIAPIPKKGTVGIEIPNRNRDMVRLRDVLEHPEFTENTSILTVPLGKDTYGDPVYVDITHMPHLLMAGATGTGKSVSINALLVSLLYKASPAELGLILIDPKILELSVYEGIPHLKVPVVTVPKQAKAVLDWAAKEMDRRYRMMQKYGVRNIDGYNKIVSGEKDAAPKKETTLSELIELSETEVLENGTVLPEDAANVATNGEKVMITEELKPLPKIIIVIDELADLMLTVGRDIEELITRLAQKARAAGIHLIVATQRPSVDVITGLIKANFPARLSFRVTSRIDSRTILDSMGAERLLGRGDMLFMQPGATHLRRIHGAFISDSEVQKVVEAVKKSASPCYDQKIIDLCEKALKEDTDGPEGSEDEFGEDAFDPLYDKAVELVVQKGQASTSMVQRVFRIGYNRAARIIEMMEREGVIGPMDGIKPREVLVQGAEDPE